MSIFNGILCVWPLERGREGRGRKGGRKGGREGGREGGSGGREGGGREEEREREVHYDGST